jgi:hypothetical protein
MTSFRQIEANRRNARLSTGPVTDEGKRRSRQNALRHGLTAETVIDALEDAEEYEAFQMAVTSDYEAQSAVERELVLRLTSLLWRLRRATAIETGLFKLQALHLLQFRQRRRHSRENHQATETIPEAFRESDDNLGGKRDAEHSNGFESDRPMQQAVEYDDLTTTFLRLANIPSCPLDRLSRYEATLWRQACQTLFLLQTPNRRRPWERMGP